MVIQAWSPLAKGIYSGKDNGKLSEAEIKTRELVIDIRSMIILNGIIMLY